MRLPLVRFFETSFGRIYERTFILVTVEEDGALGLGECVAEANPFYSSETTATAWHIIRDFIAPIVLGRAFAHPREIFGSLAAIRGHNMAKAAVEMAGWDLHARQQGKPLATVLGGERTAIESGVSIGIQDSLEQLVERVSSVRVHHQRDRAEPFAEQFDRREIPSGLDLDFHTPVSRRQLHRYTLDELFEAVLDADRDA